MRYLFKTRYKPVAQSGDLCGVGVDIGVSLFESRNHADYSGDILRARSLAALLRAALDDIRKPYPPAGIEQSDALWAVKFMSRKGEHVDVLFLDIDVYMTDRLNRVGMEDNTFLPAHRAYLGDGLNAAYLIVGIHDGHEASVLADSIGDLLSRNHAVFMHVQERDLEALFFELFERMQNRVMLKCG